MSKARRLADLGNQVDDGAITGSNMIVNGAMTVAQRGVTNTYSASDTFVVDRFFARGTSTDQLVITVTQEDDGPAGFNKSLKVNTDTAETDLASNEQFKMEHRMEGNTISHLGWGTSNAKTVTLSFWFKSSTTGTTAVSFHNQDNNRSFVSTFTVSSANTWEYKTIIVAGPTDGTWATETSIGIRIRWGSFGTEFHTTSTDQWINTQDMSVSGAIDWSDTANKYFQITGVCLNVGDSAIDFPHQSYGDELARCQRYCQRHPSLDQADGGAYSILGGAGWAGSTTAGIEPMSLPTTMRIEPTGTFSGNWRFIRTNTATAITSGPTINDTYSNVSAILMNATVGSTALTAGEGLAITQNNDADAHLILDSEL